MSNYVPDEQVPTQNVLDFVSQLSEEGKPSLTRYALQYGDIDRWFTYHPVLTPERKAAHEQVNEAAKQLAKCVMMYMPDEKLQEKFFMEIQFMRMMMNQTLTIMELDNISIPPVE